PRLVGEVRLQRIPPVERQAEPRAESFKPAAMTRICHVTTSPRPGPLTTRVVFPARFRVSVPDGGSKLASDVSPTVQRNGASGTGLLSAASRSEEHTSELQSPDHLV